MLQPLAHSGEPDGAFVDHGDEMVDQKHLIDAAALEEALEDGALTVDEALQRAGCDDRAFKWRLSLLCGVCWAAQSMETMLMGFLQSHAACSLGATPAQAAAISFAVFAGMLTGAPLWGVVSDRKGRRFSLLASLWVVLAGGLASALAPNTAWLAVSRAAVGFGLGGGTVAFTMYAEFLPVVGRGQGLVALALYFTAGAVLESLLAWGLLGGGLLPAWLAWRALAGITAAPLIGVLVGLIVWLPETAHYHASVGQMTQAKETIEWVARITGRPTPFPVGLGHLDVAPNIIKHPGEPAVWRAFLGTMASAHMTLVLMLVWFANALVYYGVVLLASFAAAARSTGDDSGKSGVCSTAHDDAAGFAMVCANAAAELPGLLAAGALVRRSRITAQWTMLAGAGVALTLAAVLGARVGLSTNSGRLVFTSMTIIARASVTGSFQVAYVYTTEAHRTSHRTTAMGIMSAAGHSGSMIAPYIVGLSSPQFSAAVLAGLVGAASVAAWTLRLETADRQLLD